MYAIVGTGGVNLHGLSGKSSFIASQQDSKFGIFDMHISANTLETKFIDNAGSILDQFSITKNVNIKSIVETGCSPGPDDNHNSNEAFKSVSKIEGDSQNENYKGVTQSEVNYYYYPVLPKIQTFKPLVKSSHDISQDDHTHEFKVEKIRQNIHEQVNQKIEKKFEGLKDNLWPLKNLKDKNKEKHKVDKKNTKSLETVSVSDEPHGR